MLQHIPLVPVPEPEVPVGVLPVVGGDIHQECGGIILHCKEIVGKYYGMAEILNKN